MATNATKNKNQNYSSFGNSLSNILTVASSVGSQAIDQARQTGNTASTASTAPTAVKTNQPPVSDYKKGLGNGFEMNGPVTDMTPGSPNYGKVVTGTTTPASTPIYSGGISSQANFKPSDAYNQAMAYTNQLLAQLSNGRTSYTDQINSLMDTINNRASFSYDPDTDPLFQQYLASSMESGKTAMQDTMAQASALTGGYGSSYATAVANGAYNNFVQQAYDNLPEYYQTALDTYTAEGNELYNRLGMYTTADQIEYDRLANAYQNNFAMANDMYGKEYNNYWDALNYNTSVAQYNQDLAYKYANLAQDQAQFEAKLASSGGSGKSGSASTGSDDTEVQYKDPTPTQYKDARKAYSEGGIEGVKRYLATQPNDINIDMIMDDVWTYGTRDKVTMESNNEKYKIKEQVAKGYR